MACQFCEDILKRNRELGLPEESSIIYEDDNIYVMPDICPLSVGHMLIISKKHYQGYANAETGTLQSVKKFLSYYRKKIGYRNYTIFEHGAVIAHTAGASVDHAHIHIIPFELKMNELLDSAFPHFSKKSLEELSEFAEKKQPYLYYKLENEKKGRAYWVEGMESQFLRKAAAQLINKKKTYNWKLSYYQGEAYLDFCKTLAWWKSLSYPITFKWKKKLILEKYKLADYKDLLEETNRFKLDNSDLMMKMLQRELEEDRRKHFRLILIPMKHQYKLPNYIISKKEDLPELKKLLGSQKGYQEIWYYSGMSQHYDDCFSGRISYSLQAYELVEIIEMVNGSNPRLIENYSGKSEKTSYLRAARKNSRPDYKIEEIHIGENYQNESQWTQCFIQLQEKMELHYDCLHFFCNRIWSYGIYSLSLDFKVENGKITFLDWDTSNDNVILENESVQ